jgi:hypothetical protein
MNNIFIDEDELLNERMIRCSTAIGEYLWGGLAQAGCTTTSARTAIPATHSMTVDALLTL